jgi:hypothetical protein
VCSAACNLISGNDEHGIFDNDSDGAVIQGNFIGTDATGTAALPNGQDGIDSNGDGTVIGNLISGNGDAGIDLGGDNTVIRGNLIGVATDGTTPLGNGEEGISLDGSNNLVGGTTSDEANVIAYNGEFGIFAGGTTSAGNLFNGNAIFANGDLGINLCLVEVFVCDGVTPNDAGDADEGPNGLQNFPELSAATLNGTLSVTGTLNSTPSTTFRVEFFANDALDASGHGEGQTYLGFADVTTDASGDAAIAAVLGSAGVAAGDFITATATDPDGNTSEFSAGVEVQ